MTRLSIIVASSGRPTLTRTLESLLPQMAPGDELLVSINDDAPWGHAARNKLMPQASGDVLMFMDDDDCYAEGALSKVRLALEQESRAMHIFRMVCPGGGVVWQRPEIQCGNVGTPMAVVPNDPDLLGIWGDRYEGDYDFISTTAEKLGTPPVWHEEIIAICRP